MLAEARQLRKQCVDIFVPGDGDALFVHSLFELTQHKVSNLFQVFRVQGPEYHNFVHSAHELGTQEVGQGFERSIAAGVIGRLGKAQRIGIPAAGVES